MRKILVVLALVMSAGLASAAQSPPNPAQPAPAAEVAPAPADASPLPPEAAAALPPPVSEALLKSRGVTLDNKSWIKKAAVWSDPVIPVCWENPTVADEQARQWVREVLAATWEKVSLVKFVGWPPCSPNAVGVRILIFDRGSFTEGLGVELDARRGSCALRPDGGPCRVLLNLRPATWSAGSCAVDAETCIKSVAVHEFGHVLAFDHEQNHPNTPDECKRLRTVNGGDVPLTPYDPASVMNYCRPKSSVPITLSKYDIETVRKLYGAKGA